MHKEVSGHINSQVKRCRKLCKGPSIASVGLLWDGTMYAVVPGTDYYLNHLPLKTNNGPRVPSRYLLSRRKNTACLSKQRMSTEFPGIITWTACLSGEMMLRELEGARAPAALQGQTVATVTAADVEGKAMAAILLLSSCFSPSISQVTQTQWWEACN